MAKSPSHGNLAVLATYLSSLADLAVTAGLVVLAGTAFDLGARHLPVYGEPAGGSADAKG